MLLLLLLLLSRFADLGLRILDSWLMVVGTIVGAVPQVPGSGTRVG